MGIKSAAWQIGLRWLTITLGTTPTFATVGKAMSSREEVSYPIMKQHEVDYVLVVFGGLLGYSGDDINKFLWMVPYCGRHLAR